MTETPFDEYRTEHKEVHALLNKGIEDMKEDNKTLRKDVRDDVRGMQKKQDKQLYFLIVIFIQGLILFFKLK